MRAEHPFQLDATIGSLERHLSEGFRAVPYSVENFRHGLVRWVITEAQPFTAVEALTFRMLLRMLKPDVPLVSANSIRRDLDSAYEREFRRMRSLLQEAPGKLSF